MRKILQASAALLVVVTAGAFGGTAGDRGAGGSAASSGGGRGVAGVMNDALDGLQNGLRGVIGCCSAAAPSGTKLGAVRSNASYDSVGAIGGGVGNDDPSGMGIGGGVEGNDPNDISGNAVGY